MPDNNRLYISKITTSQGTFYLKDSEARDLIAAISGQIQFNLATNAATTPLGVTWDNSGTLITGTLKPATNTGTSSKPVWVPVTGYYLVPQTNNAGQDYFAEYIVVTTGSSSYGGYEWEKLGDTEIDFSSLGALAWKDSVTLDKHTVKVVTDGTGFRIPNTEVVNTTPLSSGTFVKSYPGSTQKLETVSITGTNGTESVSKVTKTDVTATNTVFGEDTEASKITTIAKTATYIIPVETMPTIQYIEVNGSATVAQKGSSVNISRITLGSNQNSVLGTATVDTSTETLNITTSAVTQGSVIGCASETSTIPLYGIENHQLSVWEDLQQVNFDAVSTNTSVTVPVVTSNASRTASAVTINNVNVAKVAASATTVATGKTTSSDANGDTVMIGLGTATTGSALTAFPTLQTKEQNITLNGDTDVLRDTTDVVVS